MKFSLDNLQSLKQALSELATGLKRLDFINNFQSFETEVTIPLGTEVQIRNELTKIPGRYIVVKQMGNGLITAGPTPWDINYIYILNNSTTDSVTVKLIFME